MELDFVELSLAWIDFWALFFVQFYVWATNWAMCR